jgi:hypothetical protein
MASFLYIHIIDWCKDVKLYLFNKDNVPGEKKYIYLCTLINNHFSHIRFSG